MVNSRGILTLSKDVLEIRTKNIQASRSRTEAFVSTVGQHAHASLQQSASPLYGTPNRGTPSPNADLISLNPIPDQQMQLQMMEEGQNSYIQQRGQAIEAIEATINELGSIFGQLATMVSEQSEMIQRIDANTEDVVDNVEGAQKELLRYWSRVSGNRWLIAKMFGVLVSCSVANYFYDKLTLLQIDDLLPALGIDCRVERMAPCAIVLHL